MASVHFAGSLYFVNSGPPSLIFGLFACEANNEKPPEETNAAVPADNLMNSFLVSGLDMIWPYFNFSIAPISNSFSWGMDVPTISLPCLLYTSDAADE